MIMLLQFRCSSGSIAADGKKDFNRLVALIRKIRMCFVHRCRKDSTLYKYLYCGSTVLINVPPETWQASGKACHT